MTSTSRGWVAVAVLSLAACGDGAGDAKRALDLQVSTKAELDALRAVVSGIAKRNEDLEGKVVQLETQHFLAGIDAASSKTASFDSQADKTYQPVETGFGKVLFVLENLEPYLDGYTVTFRVGNPTAATVSGFDATVSWGPKWDVKDKATWEKQTKEVKVTNTFAPGSWSLVKVNIGPASPQQVRTIDITPRLSNVSMRTFQP